MKNLLITGAVLFIAVFALAQVFGPPTIGSDGPIATSPSQCPTSPAHGFSLCPVETGAGTGTLYISINGSAPAPLVQPVATAGVTSFNGRTGAVTSQAGDYTCALVGCPAPPVTSVNGKTGAVVLSATTSSTTSVQ